MSEHMNVSLSQKAVIDVFETVWMIEPATRPQIVAKSGWGSSVVDKALIILQEKGEVARINGRGGPQGNGSGRCPSLYLVTRTDAARTAAVARAAAMKQASARAKA